MFVQGYIPQKELLNDKRVLGLIGHGGVTSMIEALYYGKAMVALPITDDHIGCGYRIEYMGVGMSLRSDPSKEFLINSLRKVLTDPEIQTNIARQQKMIEFKELRSGKDMAYLLRRQVKMNEWGGTSTKHLYNFFFVDNVFIVSYDYDIKLMLVSTLGLSLLFMKRLVSK